MTSLSTQSARGLLQRLLLAEGWKNGKDTIAEAFPHLSSELHRDDIIEALGNLNIPFSRVRCRESEITDQECPALVFPKSGGCYIALGRSARTIRVSDNQNPDLRHYLPGSGLCTVIKLQTATPGISEKKFTSVRSAFAGMRAMLPWLLVTSLLTNVLGLLTPLLIMAIYDRVIPSGSIDMLVSLAVGVAIIGISDFAFRLARSRALAYVGWHGERQLMIALFQKLMSLPLSQLQKSDVTQQLARFRQFESLREVFTGQVMATVLDLPFVLIFLTLLFFLAPEAGLLCLGMVVVFILVGCLTIPRQRNLDRAAAEAVEVGQSLAQDAIVHQKVIANLGLQERWMRRSTPMIELAEAAACRARQFQAFTQSLAQTLSALTVVGSIILSAHGAVTADLSFGALIAAIALVSKVLTPVQTLYASFPQMLNSVSSRAQADRVLGLQEELELGLAQSHRKTLRGAISLSSVTYRPDPLTGPILSQASLNCEPGEIVLLMSSDATSRTAVLDLIDGLHTPLAGTIEHDGIDIRQIARDELRKSVTYAPYEKSLFYGTVAQNFRLACSSLSDAEIVAALDHMDLLNDTGLLAKGLETRLTDVTLAQLSDETVKALTLARSIARPSTVYLFSEPTNGFSDMRRNGFKRWVWEQRGRKTILISSADRSFLNIADRFVFLNGDRVVVNATGDAGLKKIQAALKTAEGRS